METLKIFFISIFTCSKMSEIRDRRERQSILKYYQDTKPNNRYHTFTRFHNQRDSNNGIHYPNEEVFID